MTDTYLNKKGDFLERSLNWQVLSFFCVYPAVTCCVFSSAIFSFSVLTPRPSILEFVSSIQPPTMFSMNNPRNMHEICIIIMPKHASQKNKKKNNPEKKKKNNNLDIITNLVSSFASSHWILNETKDLWMRTG
uniref:Uncharacterized protein n=1 Tax=Cacopsylla melanoneura TaxID=428564 RepID=A0A8D8TNV8_9HEMI